MAKPTLLRVYANPYTHLNEEGQPQGALPWDPVAHNPDRGHVGARLQADITARYPNGDARQQEQRTWFDFDHEPQTLPASEYYIKALLRGELVAADQETADAVGKPFEDPQAVLKEAKEEAIAHWESHHGKGSAPEHLTGHEFGTKASKAKADQDRAERAEKLKEARGAKAADTPATAARPPTRAATLPPPTHSPIRMSGSDGGDR